MKTKEHGRWRPEILTVYQVNQAKTFRNVTWSPFIGECWNIAPEEQICDTRISSDRQPA